MTTLVILARPAILPVRPNEFRAHSPPNLVCADRGRRTRIASPPLFTISTKGNKMNFVIALALATIAIATPVSAQGFDPSLFALFGSAYSLLGPAAPAAPPVAPAAAPPSAPAAPAAQPPECSGEDRDCMDGR
jgi:hypothetical protein